MQNERTESIGSRFKKEQVWSDYGYPENYNPKKIKKISEQSDSLCKIFPNLSLSYANVKLAEQPLPANAEGWFAIPQWQSVSETYTQAVLLILQILQENQRLNKKLFDRVYEDIIEKEYLRQHELTIEKFEALANQQKGDILVVAAQFGLRHRGRSVRYAREVFTPEEFGLGAFEVGCMLLTHPERLQSDKDLGIDCAGNNVPIPGVKVSFSQIPYQIPYFYFDSKHNELMFSLRWFYTKDERYGSASAFLP